MRCVCGPVCVAMGVKDVTDSLLSVPAGKNILSNI